MPIRDQIHTPWPVIWGRTLRSHNTVARANALGALRVLQERRHEQEETDRFLASRERRPLHRGHG